MPPAIRFSKEQIVEAAVALVQEEGAAALNARAVARRLGCSTQPLFREFETMAQLKTAVIERAEEVYDRYIEASKQDAVAPYKATGLAYIRFAREQGELFKLLFMRDRRGEVISKEMQDHNMDYILDRIMDVTGYTREQALTFHLIMWIYVHGLAAMVATHYQDFTDEELHRLLSGQFEAVKRGFKTGP